MSRLVRQAQAFTADFDGLFAHYTEAAGVEIARRFQAALDVTLVKLSAQPDLGRPRHFRHPDWAGLRSVALGRPFGVILVFYRANDETLDAVRLMHGARDLPRRLREPPP